MGGWLRATERWLRRQGGAGYGLRRQQERWLPEFKSLLSPLPTEKYAILEKVLMEWGCTEALKVWAGHGVLIDGHNRYEICTKHSISFDVEEIELEDRDAVIEWMLENQDARRERTELEIKDHRGRLYEIRRKRTRGGTGANQHTKKEELPHSEVIPPAQSTSQKAASEFGVGHATIERDAQFSRAVQAIATASENPIEARQVLLREGKVTAKDTVKPGKIAEFSPKAAKNVLAQIKQASTPKAASAIISEAHQQVKQLPNGNSNNISGSSGIIYYPP